jgi:hypothetical protein
MTDGANYKWSRNTDIVVQVSGEACKEAVSKQGHEKLGPKMPDSFWSSLTVDGVVKGSECRVFASVTPIGVINSDLYDSDKIAFRVDYQRIGYWVPELIKESSLTWVMPSRWQAHKLQGRREAALVTAEGKAWYFTRDNQNELLSEL